MSAPSKTSAREIKSAARKILEAEGLDAVSMQAVADAVGIRAPSLYKHFANRADLLRALTEDALAELQRAVDKAAGLKSPRESLEHMAAAYRTFAKKNSAAYQLIFSAATPRDEADLRARSASAAMLLQILTDELGTEKALPAARTLVSFLHGFVLMEQGGLFRLGGSLNEAFDFGLQTILGALLPGPAGPVTKSAKLFS